MSSTDLARAYVAQRIQLWRFVPLALIVAACGAAAGGALPRDWADWAWHPIAAFGLIVAFRVWDDLADRDIDRIRHPARVLARAGTVAPMVWVAVSAAVVSLLAVLAAGDAGRRLGAMAVLALLLWGWYRVRATLGAGPLANAQVLLLKYPAIAVIAASPDRRLPTLPEGLALLALLYCALCLYEIADDPTVRASRGARWAALANGAVAVGCLAILLT
jgi:4-hydroxybenzoate polyprenyltransferase